MNPVQEFHRALNQWLEDHALPHHGALSIEFRDGGVYRIEVKESLYVRDLTQGRALRHTVTK